MINPMSSMPTVAGGENKDDQGLTREEILEQEKLRKETLLQIEKERHKKYRKQDEQREVMRQKLRDKYNIEKRLNEEEDEDEDDDYTTFGPKPKKEETPDPMLKLQKMVDKQLSDAKTLAEEKCALQ